MELGSSPEFFTSPEKEEARITERWTHLKFLKLICNGYTQEAAAAVADYRSPYLESSVDDSTLL